MVGPPDVTPPPPSASQTVELGVLRIALGYHACRLHHHLGLLERGVVLHSPVEHHRAGPIAHGFDDTLRSLDFLYRGAEFAPGDVDLARVQRPGADAAHQESGPELMPAGQRVFDSAERAV